MVSSKTLVVPSRRGSSGWLPAPSSVAPSPSRKRLTTARAAASWSTGAWEGSVVALGAAECPAWSDATGEAVPAGPPAPGALEGRYVHVAAAPAAGAQAAIVAATRPPPVSALVR